MTIATPTRILLAALVGLVTLQPGQPRATTDTPTTTTALGDDLLTLYPQWNSELNDFLLGESGDDGSGNDGPDDSVDELADTGFDGATWGSVALAVAAVGAIVTASGRSRRPRRRRTGARSGPSA